MKFIPIAIFVLIITSCTTPKDPIKDSSWIIGTWEREFNGNTQIEYWNVTNDTIIGTNSFANGRDTTLMLNYSIFKNNDNWVLVTSDNAVEFETKYELNSINDDSLEFHNTNNNWPQTIIYKSLTSNTMEQKLHGSFQNFPKTASFTFTKKL